MVGEITYSYIPGNWNQKDFLSLGGFTVVFLNYNKSAFIERSVQSALSQDFPLCEMFFMDDASTDGSGDTMEQVVRKYRGRHKVIVVRNTENQHITGQWNIVSKLATGNWLGMFCADDIACVDRVSRAAESIEKYPGLRGLCTSAMEYVEDTKALHSERMVDAENSEICGNTLFDDFLLSKSAFGATAWWHRSLFVNPIPKGPLDDVILYWIMYYLNRATHDVIFLWNRKVKSIAYSTTGGISTSGAVRDNKITYLSKVKERKYSHRINELFYSSTRGVLDYLIQYNFSRDVCLEVKLATSYRLFQSVNAFTRLFLFPLLIYRASHILSGKCRKTFIYDLIRTTVKELLGIHLAAFFDVVKYRIKRI